MLSEAQSFDNLPIIHAHHNTLSRYDPKRNEQQKEEKKIAFLTENMID